MDFSSTNAGPAPADLLEQFLTIINNYCNQSLEIKGNQDAASSPDPDNLILNKSMIRAGLRNIIQHHLPQLENKIVHFDEVVAKYTGNGMVNLASPFTTKRENYKKEIADLKELLKDDDAFERKIEWAITSYEIGFQIGVRTYLQGI